MKAGRTEALPPTATTHTSALVRPDDVLDAAFRRCGALRVERIGGDVCHGRGVGQAAPPHRPQPDHRDQCRWSRPHGRGCTLAQRRSASRPWPKRRWPRSMRNCRPPGRMRTRSTFWATPRPPATPKWSRLRARIATATVCSLSSRPRTEPGPPRPQKRSCRSARSASASRFSPVGWAGPACAAGMNVLNRANVPTFPYPDIAARVFNYMWQYARNVRQHLRDAVAAHQLRGRAGRSAASGPLIESMRASGRTLLTEHGGEASLPSVWSAGGGNAPGADRWTRPYWRANGDRLPGRGQASLGIADPQERCGRRAASIYARTTKCAPPLRRSRATCAPSWATPRFRASPCSR